MINPKHHFTPILNEATSEWSTEEDFARTQDLILQVFYHNLKQPMQREFMAVRYHRVACEPEWILRRWSEAYERLRLIAFNHVQTWNTPYPASYAFDLSDEPNVNPYLDGALS